MTRSKTMGETLMSDEMDAFRTGRILATRVERLRGLLAKAGTPRVLLDNEWALIDAAIAALRAVPTPAEPVARPRLRLDRSGFTTACEGLEYMLSALNGGRSAVTVDANAVFTAFRAWVQADPDVRCYHMLALLDNGRGCVDGNGEAVVEWTSFAEAVGVLRATPAEGDPHDTEEATDA